MHQSLEYPRITWPEGKAFAFTAFDDTDLSTLDNVKPVYDLLADLGFRTTKSVWPVRSPDDGENDPNGSTCADPAYLAWLKDLQAQGFEIGYHLATGSTSARESTRVALDRFRALFGPGRMTLSNHLSNKEGIYFGADRLSGVRRLVYRLRQYRLGQSPTRGHVPGDTLFWGDLCAERVDYVRNFVFGDINTLEACPLMPYHDPARPYVRAWFASSEGGDFRDYNVTLSEANQDRLAEAGGACIMYTHFANGFYQGGRINPRFEELMKRLSRLGGWYVPVHTLLDYLVSVRGQHVLTSRERAWLEWRWLRYKRRFGSS